MTERLLGRITKVMHKVRLTNSSKYPLTAAPAADGVEADGKIERLNAFENGEYFTSADYPYWWSWCGWPYWWNCFNSTGRVTWKLTFDSNQSKELAYQWHYFWR